MSSLSSSLKLLLLVAAAGVSLQLLLLLLLLLPLLLPAGMSQVARPPGKLAALCAAVAAAASKPR
jgi:hypothetical protein